MRFIESEKGGPICFLQFSNYYKLLMEVLDCLLKRKRQMGPLLIRVGLMAWQRERATSYDGFSACLEERQSIVVNKFTRAIEMFFFF